MTDRDRMGVEATSSTVVYYATREDMFQIIPDSLAIGDTKMWTTNVPA